MPTLSVIIPNYNRATLIGETLDNVFAQTRPPDEVIVVDDGSTDDSVTAIEKFGSRVTLIRQENRGPGAARNRGMAAARGELIQLMDNDDLCILGHLAAMEQTLVLSGAPFAYAPWLQVRIGESCATYAGRVLQQHPFPRYRPAAAWFVRNWFTLLPACLFRRAVLLRAGPFREDLRVAEDMELLARVLVGEAEPAHCPDGLFLYRQHKEDQISRTATDWHRRANDWAEFLALVETSMAPVLGGDDLRYLKHRQRDAEHELFDAGGPKATAKRQFRWRLARETTRIGASLARRAGGSGYAAAFGEGALTKAQAAGIAALGYTPIRVSHAEFAHD